MSVWDVARGYRRALGRLLGSWNFRDYFLDRRLAYHVAAVPPAVAKDQALMARFASENILNEALYFRADLVVVMSALNVHPLPIAMLGRAGIPVVIYMTESPYDDESQAAWLEETRKTGDDPQLLILTHERISAAERGWSYFAHAYDPEIHRPVAPDPREACDVLFVGTGWQERQRLLEAVDWTGIHLRVCGPLGAWPEMSEASPIWPCFVDGVVDNETIAPRYAAAKICLNFHRQDPRALSPNPRVIELAACGAFQICDRRPDVERMFGASVPTFETPEQLGALIRRYLADDAERRRLAEQARALVQPETFDARALAFLALVLDHFRPTVDPDVAAPATVATGA